MAQTKARFTCTLAFPDSLLFPPHGEAKCVRGPSGLGTSRAEEKGASRLARAGVLAKSPPSPFGLRNTAFPIHGPSDISSGANQAPSHGFHESRDTKHESRPFIVCFDRRVVGNAGYSNPKPRPTVFHESRDTKHGFFSKRGFFRPGCAAGGSTGNRRPDHCPRRQAAVFLFAIVHHCSLLFVIVQQKNCSAPLPSRRPVAAFLRVVERHGAAMARHGRPPSPAPATRPVGFSPATRHATWFFPVPPATPGRTAPSPVNRFFMNHETRVTNHGLYAFVTAFLRVVARHGAAMARHGRPPSPAPATRPVRFSRITRHETRDTAFMLFTRQESRNTVFPVPPAAPRRATPCPARGFFTNHESRNTNHGLYAFLPTISRPPHPPGKGSARRSVAALLRVVARHGAAMARHGRLPSPAPATRPVGFSPATRHATWVFPIPPATPGRAAPSPVNRFFTNHETRDTNHGLYRPPHPPGKGSPRRPPSLSPPPGCFRCGGREGAHSSRLHGKNASHLCWFVSIRGE